MENWPVRNISYTTGTAIYGQVRFHLQRRRMQSCQASASKSKSGRLRGKVRALDKGGMPSSAHPVRGGVTETCSEGIHRALQSRKKSSGNGESTAFSGRKNQRKRRNQEIRAALRSAQLLLPGDWMKRTPISDISDTSTLYASRGCPRRTLSMSRNLANPDEFLLF